MEYPTVNDVWNVGIAKVLRHHDTYWLDDPPPPELGLYYCVRCHHHHYREGSAIGERHLVGQPTPLPVRASAGRKSLA